MPDNYFERFRRNLRSAMHRHPMTVEAICDRAGYNIAYVRKVTGGKACNPTLMFMESMAEAVDQNMIDLLTKDSV